MLFSITYPIITPTGSGLECYTFIFHVSHNTPDRNLDLNVILLSIKYHIMLPTGILTWMLYFYLYHVKYTPDRNLDLNVDIYDHAKDLAKESACTSRVDKTTSALPHPPPQLLLPPHLLLLLHSRGTAFYYQHEFKFTSFCDKLKCFFSKRNFLYFS